MENNAANSHFVAANNYIAKKKYELAYCELQNGLKLEPSSYYGHRSLCDVATKLGFREEAADHYRYLLCGYGSFENVDGIDIYTPRAGVIASPKAMEYVLDFTEQVALALLAAAWKKKSKALYRQSLAYFDTALKYDPDYAWLDVIRAWCLIDLGYLDASEAILNKWLRFQPEMPRTYAVAARLYVRKGEWIQAVRCVLAAFRTIIKYGDTIESGYRKRRPIT